MKNRLICLALALVFILSVCLTGCGEKTTDEMLDNIVDAASANTKTLSMWLVTEEKVADGVAASITEAVNKITTSKFNTYLFINFLTEGEYYAKVSEEIRAYEDSRSAFDPNASKGTSEDYIVVGDGQFAKHYPVLRDHQVDIIYVAGQDMYVEYINNGWLSSLDSELSASSKKIKEYISATLLGAAKLNGGTYAIPNNNAIGEYTYMLLNKELMEECSMDGVYNQGKINGFFNKYMFNYLETVRKHHTDVLPIDASYEDCLNLLAHYWAIDPETYEAQNDMFSVLGYRYTNPKTLSKGQTILSFDSLFADETFCENFTKLNEYRLDGAYYGEPTEGQTVAVQFVTGDYSDYEKYAEDYYPVIVKYPAVNVEDVFESMIGVCSYSVDLAASMQIVTYLNTNPDFRNLIQYGVEGEHYQLVKDETTNVRTIERIRDDEGKLLYNMDIYKTGNAFIAYPDVDAGMTEDVWEIAKDQNREALVEPLLNFDFAQLVRESGKGAEETVKIGSAGYVYTYQSGYSKDVVSENALLKKWIDASDAKGAGVYVLHTGLLNGQNFSGKIYYYNNNVSNAQVTVSDNDGTLRVNYSGTVGGGSDVTVITFNGKKNSSNLNWGATVNNADVTTTVTYQNSKMDFDFFNTNSYTVDFDYKVTKAMVVENQAIWGWINGAGTSKSIANYTKKTGDSVKSTYVVYLPAITNEYSVSVQPIVNGTTLTLDINYNETSAKLADTANKYAIFMLNVTLDAPMTELVYRFKMNGTEVTDAAVTNLIDDPRIAISGSLDVELVKFIDQLNSDVMMMLNSCTTIEEFRAVVADLRVLLTPMTQEKILENGEDLSYLLGNLKTTVVSDYASNLDLNQFMWLLDYATAKKAPVHKTYGEEEGKYDEIVKNSVTGEDYYYYDSPYTLYFNWLKANGYAK